MKMNVELIRPGMKVKGKRVFLIFGAVVAAMMLATPAPAATNAVADAMWASVDQIVLAGIAAGGGDSASAVSALDTAESLLNQAKAALSSSGFDPVKFGKKIDAADKQLVGLESYLDNSKWSEKSAVSKLASAAKSLQKLANLAGRPLLEEVTPNNSAGFLKAGALVTMAFAIPPGCTDASVSITAAPGVIADYSISPSGEIHITMGSTQGGADVSVTGCGCPVECCSRELYNYGGKTSGSSDKFPNLPKGNYGLTYSYSIGAITCCSDPQHCITTPGSTYGPTTYPMSFPLVNLKLFEKTLETAFNAAMAGANQPGCTQNVSYSPFTNDAFTVTYTVTCTSPGCTGGATTFIFTLHKL